jgi:hypothetical protein
MEEHTQDGSATDKEAGGYEPPRFMVISLACEITAYAPDGDQPLF